MIVELQVESRTERGAEWSTLARKCCAPGDRDKVVHELTLQQMAWESSRHFAGNTKMRVQVS